VGAQSWPVKRIDLRAEKIKIPPARFRTATDQLDIRVRKRNHAADAQIFLERALLDIVERHFPAERAVAKFEPVIFMPAGDRERFLTEAHDGSERRTALCLEPEQNARGLEDRSLPLPVST